MPTDSLAADLALLKECDDHDGPTNDYEKEALESMLRQVKDAKRSLTEKQRAWAADLKDKLDTWMNYGSRGGGDDE